MFCKGLGALLHPQALEFQNHVHGKRELAVLSAAIVRGHIVGVLKPEFGTKKKRGAHPMSPHQRVF